MTQSITIAEAEIRVVPHVPPCELRIERPIADDPHGRHEYVCGADGIRLAVVGEDNGFMERTCNACDLPDVLAYDKRACLHLRPVRVIVPDETATSYYACRWFYRLNPHHQPTSIDWCSGCPYWFPRPALGKLDQQRYWAETAQIRAALTDPNDRPPRHLFPPPLARQRAAWWQRFLERLFG